MHAYTIGTLLMTVPHFLMGRYKYESTISASTNSSTVSVPCSQDPGQLTELEAQQQSSRIVGCLHTIAVIGPLFGFTLGSFCAKLYVDIRLVDLEVYNVLLEAVYCSHCAVYDSKLSQRHHGKQKSYGKEEVQHSYLRDATLSGLPRPIQQQHRRGLHAD
ncbi:Solute carrier organic anion transporter family member 1A5 [Acipenser ruthenus]|uniref:Solute carrier organic anion transporter family member 1A5 n=1 Tax=Acipenser ruthenus TaxID=7906 RepID=A0A662YQU4_ACIRT|nr:Solute carrier organic anion transporter family member 1A5 [Acipenser ruthenus]